jgi:hypothetical protein
LKLAKVKGRVYGRVIGRVIGRVFGSVRGSICINVSRGQHNSNILRAKLAS